MASNQKMRRAVEFWKETKLNSVKFFSAAVCVVVVLSFQQHSMNQRSTLIPVMYTTGPATHALETSIASRKRTNVVWLQETVGVRYKN